MVSIKVGEMIASPLLLSAEMSKILNVNDEQFLPITYLNKRQIQLLALRNVV